MKGGWWSKDVRSSHDVGFWKAIRNLCELESSQISFSVGNGRKIKFWKDKWCEGEPLCDSFPSLFALSNSKEAWLANLWMHSNGRGAWFPIFSRSLNDWEVEAVECFLSRLQDKVVVVEGEDKLLWAATKSGSFSIKSLYSILEAGRVEAFPSNVMWNAWVLPKVSFFACEALWGKVLTLDQLQRKGWVLANRKFNYVFTRFYWLVGVGLRDEVFLFSLYFLVLFGGHVYHGAPLLVLFINTIAIYLSKKKKKSMRKP